MMEFTCIVCVLLALKSLSIFNGKCGEQYSHALSTEGSGESIEGSGDSKESLTVEIKCQMSKR